MHDQSRENITRVVGKLYGLMHEHAANEPLRAPLDVPALLAARRCDQHRKAEIARLDRALGKLVAP